MSIGIARLLFFNKLFFFFFGGGYGKQTMMGWVFFYFTYPTPFAVFGEKTICVLFKMMNLSGDFGSEAHIYITVGSVVVHRALSTVKAEKAGTPNPLYMGWGTHLHGGCSAQLRWLLRCHSAEMTSQKNAASSPYAPCGHHIYVF